MDLWLSCLSPQQASSGELVKHRLLGPTSRVGDSAGLEWSQKICISNQLPAAANNFEHP